MGRTKRIGWGLLLFEVGVFGVLWLFAGFWLMLRVTAFVVIGAAISYAIANAHKGKERS